VPDNHAVRDISIPDRSILPLYSLTVCGILFGMAVSLHRALAQRSDPMSIVNRATASAERLAQAAAYLQQAILLIEEVAPGIVEKVASGTFAASIQPLVAPAPIRSSGNGASRPAITDRATFCVHWANRTCHLGNTMPFKLLERLACRPNQFIHYDVLLRDLWDCHTSYEAVRSAVKILRKKLIAAGMDDLAQAIDGSTAHHYALLLMKQ
jgi:hypothetical protein